MIRVAVIGAGLHSSQNHLPALRLYAGLHPGEVELTALCDINPARAKEAAAEFGFGRNYASYDQMLRETRPDAVMAITPIGATAAIASDIMSRSIPLLMEKPLAASLQEAERLVAHYERCKSLVMVSMNRRFEPVISGGKAFLTSRPFRRLHVTFARQNRLEKAFVSETGVHAVDTVCYLADSVPVRAKLQSVPAKLADWALIQIEFASGATATIDLMPTCGVQAEQYDCCGDDYRLVIRSALFDAGTAVATEGEKIVLSLTAPPSDPPFVRNGTLAETEAFLKDLAAGKPFSPTPTDALVAMRIAHLVDSASWQI